ncbi:hypothetical protein Taro_050152 [Colocasia esculenta]|uniref:chitinase n=1 Tax=Colocasia esculenta TaxID=4460 RepID=A0A843XD20_COLES|nr:hypothetical protein [Colocasia esculenta]
MASQADVRLVLSILVLRLPSSPEAPSLAGGIAIYWGKGNSTSEGNLTDVCNTGKYSHIMLASLTEFGEGRTPKLSLGGHCDPASAGCTRLGAELRTCQARGVKVLLSIGGGGGRYGLSSADDAQKVARYLWNSFLGGQSSTRPLGDAVLDGIDFVVVQGPPSLYGLLARAIKKLGRQGGRDVYLSAAPECPFPDAYLGAAIDTGVLDFVWVQFFDNPSCQYEEGNMGKLWEAWNQWANISAGQVFLGLLAGDVAAIGGYIPPAVLVSQVLPVVKASPKYGGVLLWSKQFFDIGHYNDAIRGSV